MWLTQRVGGTQGGTTPTPTSRTSRKKTEVPSLYAGLTSAQELAARQAEANRQAEEAAARSSMAGLTLRTAMEDVREAVVGLPADLFGQSGAVSLGDVLGKNDRLRGLGILVLLGALASIAIL